MSALTTIMDEMANTLRSALASATVQVEPRMLLNPTPPTLDIYPGDPFSDDEGAGFNDPNGRLMFTIRARVGTADIDAGQELLLAMMDDENTLSVATALFDDQTLNGTVSSVRVDGPSGYTVFVEENQAPRWLGCTWQVTVLNATT